MLLKFCSILPTTFDLLLLSCHLSCGFTDHRSREWIHIPGQPTKQQAEPKSALGPTDSILTPLQSQHQCMALLMIYRPTHFMTFLKSSNAPFVLGNFEGKQFGAKFQLCPQIFLVSSPKDQSFDLYFGASQGQRWRGNNFWKRKIFDGILRKSNRGRIGHAWRKNDKKKKSNKNEGKEAKTEESDEKAMKSDN